MKQMTIFVSTL